MPSPFRGLIRFFSPLLLGLSTAICLWSQGSAYLTGYLQDQSGAAIPNAAIVIKNENTGVTYDLKSTETGVYRSPALDPGSYELRASAPGFQDAVTRGISVLVGQPRGLDVTLQVGTATQLIEVQATSPLLKTEDAGLGQSVQYKQVASLPYFNRSAGALISLAPTVRYTGEDVISYGASRYNVGGFTNVNIQIDGASVVGDRTDVAQMTFNPSVESLQEVKVTTNQFSAEFGKDVGALVQMETKSGTNSFHGSLYEYLRNEKLDTMNAFSRTRPIDRQNMFGGAIGGPVVKNKLFFFSTLEIQKSTAPAGFLLSVPTEQMKQGDFSALPRQLYNPFTSRREGTVLVRDPFPGNVIPSGLFDPAAVKALTFVPGPTNAGLNNNLPSSTGTRLTKYRSVNRVDWNFGANDRLAASYMFDHTFNENLGVDAYNAINQAGSPTLAGFGFRFFTQVWNISEHHTFSPNLFMTNRFVYRPRYIERVNPAVDPAKQWGATLGIKNFAGARLPASEGGDLGFPSYSFTGYTGLGPGSLLFQERPIKQGSWDLDLTYVKNRHTLKAGFQVELGSHGASDQSTPTGSFNFGPLPTSQQGISNSGDAIASFLLGQVNSASTTLGPLLTWHSWYYAAYLQDDWKVTQNLTLNLGIRWDIDAPVYESEYRGNAFDFYETSPVSGTPGVVKFLNRPSYPAMGFYKTDFKRIAPRFGFAWKPMAKTVLRGGYGIYNTNPVLGANRRAPSLGFTTSGAFGSADGGFTPPFLLKDGFPDYPLGGDLRRLTEGFGAVQPGQTPSTSPTFVDPNWRFGYSQNFNMSFQRELPFNMVLEIAGQGTLGRRIAINGRNWNEVNPAMWGLAGSNFARRPFPQYGNVSEIKQAAGTVNYYNGYVRLDKQFSRGLVVIANYSFGKTTGMLGGSIYSPELSHGVVFYDEANGATAVPFQSASISWAYDLPMGKGYAFMNQGVGAVILGGWSLGGLLRLNGGIPFTITSGGDSLNANSPLGGRVDIVGDPKLSNPTPSRWFNTAAFAAPANGKVGNFLGPLLGPSTTRLDVSLRKTTTIKERWRFILAGEAFNFTNTPQYGPPVNNLRDARFGQSINEGGGLGANTTGPYGARIIQVGARVEF